MDHERISETLLFDSNPFRIVCFSKAQPDENTGLQQQQQQRVTGHALVGDSATIAPTDYFQGDWVTQTCSKGLSFASFDDRLGVSETEIFLMCS